MRYLKSFLLLCAAIFTFGCNSQKEVTQSTGAKTMLGQSVEKAHGASHISDEHNDELKKQADALKDE